MRGDGLNLRFGPFTVRLRTVLRDLTAQIADLYRDYPVEPDGTFSDFHVHMASPFLRRFLRPQALFLLDGVGPYTPMPARLAFPTLEWGLNWCIANLAQNYVMFHSATLERNGRVLMLPGMPGSGKSTLCAALAHRGWRLLSDEFGLVRPRDMVLMAMPRPISLKNESIAVMRAFAPEARLGPSFEGTAKGTVAHVVPAEHHIVAADQCAPPGWLVFPSWERDAPLELDPISRMTAFMQLASNAFNYELRGEDAFRTIAHITRECGLYSLRYSDLDSAVDALAELP